MSTRETVRPNKNPIATVDYVTVTTHSAPASANLVLLLQDGLTSEFMAKNPSRPWQFCGYHGYSREGMRYGMRGDEAIVMLSGPTAAELWQKISPKRSKCTRIDLAVTVPLQDPDLTVAAEAYRQCCSDSRVGSSHVVNSRGGTTTYFGSRTSRFFGRLYDKGAEQGAEAGWLWRYEVEVKKPAAEPTVEALLSAESPGEWISAFVWEWFANRGHNPLYSPANVDSAIEVDGRVSSADRQLEWLRSGVRPTVQKLLVGGLQIEVIDALGLTKIVETQGLLGKEFD
jgi:hypothetical protein